MQKATLLLGLATLFVANYRKVEAAPLRCDSFLRVVRPDLFTHCIKCDYGSWSNWKRTGASMSNSQCPSKRSYREKRTQKDRNGKCDEKIEFRTTCEPTLQQQANLFIAALGLGKPASVTANRNRTLSITRRMVDPIQLICGSPSSEICVSRTGRGLSVSDEERLTDDDATIVQADDDTVINDDTVANPFDFDKHLSVIRAHRLKRDTERYVLFMLDSSGSIGSTEFTRLKAALSSLVPLFCEVNKFAVMSFGAKIERNICFSCDQGGDEDDRTKLLNALLSIKYHRGSSTRTGDAIRCACDYMLKSSCGFHNDDGSVVTDVILFTDGRSNKGESPCFATKCFPDYVNVIPVGIGNYAGRDDELMCIQENNAPSGTHYFTVTNIDGLEKLLQTVFDTLDPNKNPNAPRCA